MSLIAAFAGGVSPAADVTLAAEHALEPGPVPDPMEAPDAHPRVSCLVGHPTDRSVTLSVEAQQAIDLYVEYLAGQTPKQTKAITLKPKTPTEITIDGLEPDRLYHYRLHIRLPGKGDFQMAGEAVFQTQRKPGDTFTFCVQGDSHPERAGRMFDAALYRRALANVAADKPDFYFLLGDDFSIERLIERADKSQDAVNAIYAAQRAYLETVGRSTPLMLVNGNHEQAAKYLLDGTANNFAVLAGRARNDFFPLPAPDGFYSGNKTPVEHVGLLRDYYAWDWGDALFVVIDPYWHSDVPVDNEAGTKAPAKDQPDGARRGKGKAADQAGDQPRAGRGQRDLWQITLGDEQYQWLRETLTRSRAPFKFVFSHHVLGTGRGGIEQATKYEWGGDDRRGIDRFFAMRPKWEKPIHDLMRDTGVTIFFQGHDHLYAKQELDGVIYQTCPNPADPTFTAFNRQSYTAGDIFPNSGHLRITVSGKQGSKLPACKVEYIRAARPEDEADHGKNASIVHEYTLHPRALSPAPAPAPHNTPKPEDPAR
ncbi:MAG: metallophosphoesterase [Phycisphaerales bacterium]